MPTPFGYVSQLLRRWLLKAITERISKYENENDVKTQAPTAQGEPLSTCAGRLPPTKQQNQSPHNRLAACNVRLASMHSKNKESARISLKCPWSACVIHDYFRVRTFNASSPPHQQPNYQPLACIFIDIKKQKKRLLAAFHHHASILRSREQPFKGTSSKSFSKKSRISKCCREICELCNSCNTKITCKGNNSFTQDLKHSEMSAKLPLLPRGNWKVILCRIVRSPLSQFLCTCIININ